MSIETQVLNGQGIKSRLLRANRQFIKYCLVGASGMIINLAIFNFIFNEIGVYYMVAATISFIFAATSNFLLNKYWTFGNPKGAVSEQIRRFIIISAIGLGLNLLILPLLTNMHYVETLAYRLNYVEILGYRFQFASAVVAQVITITLVTVFNFTGNKMWSFRRSKS